MLEKGDTHQSKEEAVEKLREGNLSTNIIISHEEERYISETKIRSRTVNCALLLISVWLGGVILIIGYMAVFKTVGNAVLIALLISTTISVWGAAILISGVKVVKRQQ